MPTLLLLCSSSCQSTSYKSPVSTSHTRAPPPPPESSPYLPVSNSQDRDRIAHIPNYVVPPFQSDLTVDLDAK